METAQYSSRRRFLRDGSLLLLGAKLATRSPQLALANDGQQTLRVGLMTDLHYADKPARGSRHYRETLGKIAEAGLQFQKEKPDFVVELGDFIDSAGSLEMEKQFLARIHKEFAALPGEKHYVLGNHCVHTLLKPEFLDGVGKTKSFYSFDKSGFHFIVLDACFRQDGQPYGRDNFQWTDANIPADQVEWLQADLKATSSKTIVFAHQRLDVKKDYTVKNADQVRKVLEDSGKVLAVFQGHSHKNDLQDINGIHYCTLVAMVEGSGESQNAYSLMDIFANGTIQLRGFRKQANYDWARS